MCLHFKVLQWQYIGPESMEWSGNGTLEWVTQWQTSSQLLRKTGRKGSIQMF